MRLVVWRTPSRQAGASCTAFGSRGYQVYVPLDEPGAVGYWIDNGRRRGGIRPRLARALKDVLVGVGAQHHLFNNFLVIARRDP